MTHETDGTLQNITLAQYLQNSLDSCPATALSRGWGYLKENITPELKAIVSDEEYWKLEYNAKMKERIIEKLNAQNLTEEQNKQIGTFVYIRYDMRRERQKVEAEQQLKTEMEARGFRRIVGSQKELNGLKVTCVMDVSVLGIFGSYDKTKELEEKKDD